MDIFFGGTFDPVHLGHLYAADNACSALESSRVLFTIFLANPRKRMPPVCSMEHRLHMLQLSTADRHNYSIETWENSPYVLDAITNMQDRQRLSYPAYFLVGDDVLADMPYWNRIHALAERVHFAIITRVNRSEKRYDELLKAPDMPKAIAETAVLIQTKPMLVSSSRIRTALKQNRAETQFLTENVYDYIQKNQLYC